MSSSSNNDQTLTELVASLTQLTLALQAHLTANGVETNRGLPQDPSTPLEDNSSSGPPISVPRVSQRRQPNVHEILPNTPPPPDYLQITGNTSTDSGTPPMSPGAITHALRHVHSRKWYTVTVGKEPGVYSNWLSAKAQVDRVPGNAIQRFPNKAGAIAAYQAAWDASEVKCC